MLDKGFKPEAFYTYTDPKGEPLYWRIRVRHPDTGEKWIRPMRRSGVACELGEPDFPNGKPLYRLHELAARPGAPAWFVEGENCADALAKLGLLATTAGSTSSDERADFSPLAGRAVTIWPDNDAAGIGHAERVAVKLRALGCTVELIDARALGLPEKGDFVDWIEAHPDATSADLAKLPRARAVRSEQRNKLDLVPIGKLLAEPQEQIPWLVDGLLPAGGISALAARPKVGKSTLARELAVCVARGEPLLGRATTQGGVFILDLEGKRGETVSALRRTTRFRVPHRPWARTASASALTRCCRLARRPAGMRLPAPALR